MDEGIVTELKPSIKFTDPNLMNIMRGILSAFQLRTDRRKLEIDMQDVSVNGNLFTFAKFF